MENPSFTTRFLRFLNGLTTLVLMVIVGLWSVELLTVQQISETITTALQDVPVEPRYVLGACAVIVLFLNLYNLVASLGSDPYDTHLRSETEDGEVSIAVHAVEDTLERAVEALGDIKESTVNVLKRSSDDGGPIHVRTTVITHEQTKFKDVVEHVRSILKQRWNEIIDLEEKPYIEIVLGDVSQDTAENQALMGESESSDQAKNDEDPYLSDTFSGPKYPVDEDEDEDESK